ncbi:MAG TPA: hypothetical protein EYM97_08185 [Gemmatimonadetes bacterium]|jgi:hypothetical protein|nr:hypothetical protein [Gemmatimonadota bacterium]
MILNSELPHDRRNFVHKRIFGAAKGFATGGFSGALGGFLTQGGSVAARVRPASPTFPAPPTIRGGRTPRPISTVTATPGIAAFVQRAIPGGRTGLQVSVPVTGGCPSGFHPNKSDYMTKAGFVAQGSKCVRNRRRNLSNGRANTRALRRMAAWDKQERRLGKTMKAIARGR